MQTSPGKKSIWNWGWSAYLASETVAYKVKYTYIWKDSPLNIASNQTNAYPKSLKLGYQSYFRGKVRFTDQNVPYSSCISEKVSGENLIQIWWEFLSLLK